MKVGDLVKFRQLDPCWGEVGIITEIKTTQQPGPEMIFVMTPVLMQCTSPWSRRRTYIKEVISEVS